MQVLSVFNCTFLLSGTPFNKRHCRQSRTANLHRVITFHNQSADLSACAGRPLADFRRLGEQSDCFENTVWAQGASLFEKQSIGGAAKQENQQVDRASGEIALDVENLPCANGCSEAPSQTLPFESVSANGKVVHIRFDRQELVKEKSIIFTSEGG